MKEVSEVLHQVSTENFYDSFIHYAHLGAWSRESGIPYDNWEELLDTWPYSPETFMTQYGRGNCVDFAGYTAQQFDSKGIEAHAVGVLPDLFYSRVQRDFLTYQHASVVGQHNDQQFFCEPGWNMPDPIATEAGSNTFVGDMRFHTIARTKYSIQQRRVRPDGPPEERIIDLRPLHPDALTTITRQSMRLANRRMILAPRLGQAPIQHHIRIDTNTDLLTATFSYLPKRFHPNNIKKNANRKLSSTFGFDVKEELLACYAVREALPKDFWIA